MKIAGENEALVKVGQAVMKVVSQRSALPVLSGIRIAAEGQEVVFDATDLEVFISVRATGFAVEEPGAVVVPARLFGDILKSLPAGRVEIEGRPADGRVMVRGGKSEFSVTALPVEDFPAVPDMPGSEVAVVEAPELAAALKQVVRAVSTDEGRPVLTGVLWSLEGGTLRLAATDSYRLAVREMAVKEGPSLAEAIIPGKMLADLVRNLAKAKAEDEVKVWLGETQAGFEAGKVRMVTRLIEGKFPDYKQLIPTAYPSKLTIDRGPFSEAIDRMGLIAKAATPVKLHLSDGVKLTATQTGVAEASEDVEGEVASYDGDAMVVGFNPRFLVDGLDALAADSATVELIDPGRPCLIRAGGHEEFMWLLMPVRL